MHWVKPGQCFSFQLRLPRPSASPQSAEGSCERAGSRLGGSATLLAMPLHELQGGNDRSECAETVANPKGTERLPLILL